MVPHRRQARLIRAPSSEACKGVGEGSRGLVRGMIHDDEACGLHGVRAFKLQRRALAEIVGAAVVKALRVARTA